MKFKRICIYPKDVQCITGKSERYGRKLIQDIKSKLGKEAHQLVTVKEFCNYVGLSEYEVQEYLQN